MGSYRLRGQFKVSQEPCALRDAFIQQYIDGKGIGGKLLERAMDALEHLTPLYNMRDFRHPIL